MRFRLSDIEPKFVCAACGRRGADVRPDWETVSERPRPRGLGKPELVKSDSAFEEIVLKRGCSISYLFLTVV
jgi:hypothetical protein